jgi:hypothetical protein
MMRGGDEEREKPESEESELVVVVVYEAAASEGAEGIETWTTVCRAMVWVKGDLHSVRADGGSWAARTMPFSPNRYTVTGPDRVRIFRQTVSFV